MRAATFVLAAGLAFQSGLRADDPPNPPGAARDADVAALKKDVEALKKQVAALRKTVEALEPKPTPPDRGRHKVVVTTPRSKDIETAQPYAGKIFAQRHISVRAVVGGVVATVPVKEGQAVKKGDILFQVTPTLSRAKVDAETAEVRIAQLEFDNARTLFDQKVVTRLEVALHEAKLARAQARAKLAEAELAFTTVRAPFDGLVGRIREQEGSAVKEGDDLTTLSDNSAVWVYFGVPEARYLEYVADQKRTKEEAPVGLVLADGSTWPEAGKLGAIEADFRDGTGSISFRADFPNPDRVLRHGQTATVVVRRALKNALVIPQRAAFEERGRWYVYVVGPDGAARRREVAVRGEAEGVFVVGNGLGANDRIVLDGVGQVRDGEKVEYDFRKPEGATRSPERRPEK